MSAKNITVVTLSGQRFNRTLKKAKELCAKGTHLWRGDFTLIEIVPGSSHPDYARLLIPGELRDRRPGYVKSTYIPEKMPPREVPGVYFQEPESDTWRIQHRNVSFLPQNPEIVVNP